MPSYNQTALLHSKAAKRDVFGKEAFAAAVPLRLSIVKLADSVEQSSVRADSSASRGAAQETTAQALFLVPPNTGARKGDVVELLGFLIEITGTHVRLNTRGAVDHVELHGKIREEL